MESTDLAIYSHEKRFIIVSEKIEVKVHRWNLNINATISRMFQNGWIEVRGFAFSSVIGEVSISLGRRLGKGYQD